MNLIVKTFNLVLSVILLNSLLPIEAQLNNGISVVLGKKHYYIETVDTGNFYQAVHACAKLGMTLASFEEGSTEKKNVYNVLYNADIFANKYWLSGINVGSANDKFIWLGTGKPSTTTLTTKENCLSTDETFKIIAESCTAGPHYYICEKPFEPYCGILGQCRYTYSSISN